MYFPLTASFIVSHKNFVFKGITLYGGHLYSFVILDMELSPDGRYAAVLACRHDTDEVRLYVIRLADQAYLLAEGLDIYEDPGIWSQTRKGQILGNYASSQSNKGYHPVLNWTEAGLITNCSKTQLWDIGQ